jgi:hypothetical protein
MSALTASASAQGLGRPNFLWYVAEDLNPYIGAYGDPLARTPNIDRLARDGVRFATTYSASPVCAPLPEHIRGFTENLRAAGYYCTNNAKTDSTRWSTWPRRGTRRAALKGKRPTDDAASVGRREGARFG